jgi:hypothetical protein
MGANLIMPLSSLLFIRFRKPGFLFFILNKSKN